MTLVCRVGSWREDYEADRRPPLQIRGNLHPAVCFIHSLGFCDVFQPSQTASFLVKTARWLNTTRQKSFCKHLASSLRGSRRHGQTTRLVEVAVGSRGSVAARDAPSYKTSVSFANTMFILKLCTKKTPNDLCRFILAFVSTLLLTAPPAGLALSSAFNTD